MMTRTEGIAKMLRLKALPDLAALYTQAMECQVLVARDGGTREGDYQGWRGCTWTDGSSRWYPIRIPKDAGTEPVDNSLDPLTYDIVAHAEGIGMTGWDWKNRCSKWVAFDFDAITGHSDKHAKKLSDEEMSAVRKMAEDIEWVTTRRSASGRGLHLYVFLNNFPTQNHHEHAALARSILSMMSALARFDFINKVDVCGGNMWVWHRKMTKENRGFELLKQGTILDSIPPNWKDHVKVVTGQRRKIAPMFIEEKNADLFDELTGQRPHIKLDDEHKKLLDWLRDNNCVAWWDTDHHMLVTHTIHLAEAHVALDLKGVFKTASKGDDKGNDHNCFVYPLRRGAWSVRRYTPGCAEDQTWTQDGVGWTYCYYNKEPDLATASRHLGAVENEKSGWVFQEAAIALKAARILGANIDDLPSPLMGRQTILKQHKDGNRIVVELDHNPNDRADEMRGWLAEKGKWKRVVSIAYNPGISETDVGNYDDLMRHVVSESGEDAGWTIKADAGWHMEPLVHAKAALKANGTNAKDIDLVVGSSVCKPWVLCNRPFEPEYPGDRLWNRRSAQLRISPADSDGQFEHWRKILKHCGAGLNDALKFNAWAQVNSINDGSEYLMLWIASLIQFPKEPLPYLFLYGPDQNSGKSIFHESMDLLISRGITRAGHALKAKGDFNAELENAVLCVIEEIDIAGASPKEVYNKIKDWVTSPKISIHRKNYTPYDSPNTTHWIQVANDHESCPIFTGDTRITMAYVGKLDPLDLIPKKELMSRLRQEAPYFLRHVLSLELPPSNDRLNIPIIETEQKKQAGKANQTLLEKFIAEKCYHVAGAAIPFKEFWEKFQDYLLDEQDKIFWSKIKTSKSLPPEYPSGTPHGCNNKHIGNISWTSFKPGDIPSPMLVLRGDALVPSKE